MSLSKEEKGRCGMEKANQYTFQRYEMKFLIPAADYVPFRREMEEEFRLDEYGLSRILNIYYDTDRYDLASRSLRKPKYKEKLRLRSYGVPGPDSPVFAELKKKVGGIVYKRRSEMTWREADRFLNGAATTADRSAPDGLRCAAMEADACPAAGADPAAALPVWEFPLPDTQINRELRYFLDFYHPEPKMVLCYDREAFFRKSDPAVRLTIDRNIRYRTEDLDLTHGDGGEILDLNGGYLLELKVGGAMPADLSRMFAKHRVYPVSFSKYGKIYETLYARPARAQTDAARPVPVRERTGTFTPAALLAGLLRHERRKSYVYQHS